MYRAFSLPIFSFFIDHAEIHMDLIIAEWQKGGKYDEVDFRIREFIRAPNGLHKITMLCNLDRGVDMLCSTKLI